MAGGNASGGRPLERYVPRILSEWDLDAPGRRWRRLDGTMCFVDISGFTNLSEKLARRGRIGAEELTEVLNRVFGTMLHLAYDRGGSLLKFGGDALLLLFEGVDHPVQGASAAVEMRAALREATKIPTSVGRIQLKMSVGVHTGEVDVFRAGGSHHELVITGQTATTTTEMEHAADAGEILISPALRDALPAGSAPEAKDPGYLLRWRRAPVPGPGPIPRREIDDDTLLSRVPVMLRGHLGAGRVEPEHRVATIGFVKFTGVDAAMRDGGAEAVADDLHALVSAIQDAVDAEGVTFLATDIDEDGGKVILSAGVPIAQEDDEGRVLRAVRRIADSPLPFPLKIGVNRGHVFSGDIGTDFRSTYTVMGDTVNLAARLMAAAPSGAVYVAPSVLDRSHTVFATVALEPFFVKGKDAPVQAYAVGEETGIRTARTQGNLPFTGRDWERAVLREALSRAVAGTGGAITIAGDTGIGKTRLVSEALDGLHDEIRTFTVQADPYGADSPYWAFRDPLRALLGIERTSQAEMAAKLAVSVASLAPDLVPLIPLIGGAAQIEVPDTPETAAIEPRFRPERTAAALIRMIEAAMPGPLAIVVEDGHWLDEASIGLAMRIAGAAYDRPWLVLITTRPGAERLTERPSSTVSLGPLTVDAARTMALVATEAAPLRPHELDTVVSRAAGNPLFLEEILELVRQTGSVDALPDSLDAVVGREIDTLAPLSRRLLRYTAVLGRSFRRVVLEELLAPEEVMLDAATQRDLARFIEPDGDTRWRFRHSVMHDVAYQGLSYRKRKELHERAGQVIERLAGDDTDAVAEPLALHYTEAGVHEKAWRYGVVAGDRAKAASANVEAAGHYRRALGEARLVGSVPTGSLATVAESLGVVLERAGMFDEALTALGRSVRMLQGDPVMQAKVMVTRALTHVRVGSYAAAVRQTTTGLRALDGATGPEAAMARSQLASLAGGIRLQQGRPAEALVLARKAEPLALAAGDRRGLAWIYTVLDGAYEMLGRPEEAVYADRTRALYEELGELNGVATVDNNVGVRAYDEGRWDDAVAAYTRAQEAFERAGNLTQAAGCAANLGEVLVSQGRLDEAEPLLQEAVRVLRRANLVDEAIFAQIQQARIAIARGDAASTTDALAELMAEAVSLGQRQFVLEAGIQLANALVRTGEAARALEVLDSAEDAASDLAVYYQAPLMRVRAEAAIAEARLDDAVAMASAGLEAARGSGLVYEEALLLRVRAGAAGGDVGREDLEEADRLLQALGVVGSSVSC